jgi:hypothetical protein
LRQPHWDEWLPQAEFSVNNAWQKSIKNTPKFMLNFGQQPRTPLNQSGGREVRVPQANNFVRTLEENLARAKASLLAARSRQKLFADERRTEELNSLWDKMSFFLQSTSNLRIQGRASCYPSG